MTAPRLAIAAVLGGCAAAAPAALRWECQRTDDSWATAAPMITIDYRRSR